jgi:hypothetical protein
MSRPLPRLLSQSLPATPDVFEGLRAHRRVLHRVGDAGMPKEVLKAPRIHSACRQGVPCRVPQHVNVHWKRQPSGFPSSFNHTCDAHATERCAALIHEHERALDAIGFLLTLQQSQAVDLVALQVMHRVGAALEPANDDGALRQVYVVPAQILCDRPKCRSIWAMKSGFGHFAPFALESISEVPVNQGVLSVPNRVGWRIIAGPPLTPSQFHCATVGAVAAISDSDLINSAHWRAAKEWKWGYRLSDDSGEVSRTDSAKSPTPILGDFPTEAVENPPIWKSPTTCRFRRSFGAIYRMVPRSYRWQHERSLPTAMADRRKPLVAVPSLFQERTSPFVVESTWRPQASRHTN